MKDGYREKRLKIEMEIKKEGKMANRHHLSAQFFFSTSLWGAEINRGHTYVADETHKLHGRVDHAMC